MSTLIKLRDGKRILKSDRSLTKTLFVPARIKSRMTTLDGLGCACGPKTLGELGFAAGGVVQGAALGAKAGSIVPGVGNVVGAVVGAVLGLAQGLLGKKKPVRPSGQQVADCQTLLKEYENFAATGAPPSGRQLGLQQLKDLNWCIQAIYGGHYTGTKDPRWFDGSFALNENLAKKAVRAVFNTPVGQTVTVKPEPWTDPKGRVIQSNGFSFTNPQFISLKDLNDNYFMPAVKQVCQDTAGKGAPGCSDYYNLPVSRRLLLDLLDYAASVELPQVDVASLNPPASTTTSPSGAPLPAPVSSIPQGPQTTPLAVTQPPAMNLPVVSTAASPQSNLDSQIAALVQSLTAQGASQQEAFANTLQALNSKGIAVTPQVQEAVATEVKKAGNIPAWVLPVAGGVGLLGIFLFMRKRRR